MDGDRLAKEAQWTQASNPIMRPLPTPGFTWTSLASRSREVVLPVQLQPKKRTRIFFRASRPTFEVYLASQRSSRMLTQPISFQIAGLQCLAQEPSRNTAYRNLEFNKRVGQGVQPVLYCLDINGPESRITLSHAGVSSMLSTASLEMTKVPTMPTYASFRVPPGYISFTDVRVYVGNEDTHLLEHERSWRVLEADDAEGGDGGDGGDASVQVGLESGPAQGLLSFIASWFKTTSELPICDKGVTCELAQRREAHAEHMKEKRHLCLHGRTCRQRGDSEHMKQFVHLDKPECPSGGHCALLGDLHHRAKFHHANMWDLLLPCRYGRTCRAKDPAHRMYYHHSNSSYDLTEEGLRLLSQARKVGYVMLCVVCVQRRDLVAACGNPGPGSSMWQSCLQTWQDQPGQPSGPSRSEAAKAPQGPGRAAQPRSSAAASSSEAGHPVAKARAGGVT